MNDKLNFRDYIYIIKDYIDGLIKEMTELKGHEIKNTINFSEKSIYAGYEISIIIRKKEDAK
jgi:hypothetical protein